MELVPHNPTRGVYSATDDYVHALEVSVTSYAEDNAAARVEALGGRTVPTTGIVVEMLVEEWLVELEVVAAA